MGPFVYLEPKSIEEALSLLTKYGEKVKVLAGGTDLVPLMRQKSLNPQYVVNIGNLDSYKFIHFDHEAGLCIGALTTIREIETSSILKTEYKMIPQAAAQLASIPIRNIATLGGNLCHASPAADMAPILMALSARVKLVSTAGERVVSLMDFFTGPADIVCKPDELMTEVQIAQLLPNTYGVYLKCSTKGGQELALVGVAVVITLDSSGKICNDVKIALGSVAPTPMRAYKAEATMKGRALNNELIWEAAQVASSEARPIDDIRGSAEYRKEMLKVFTRDALNQVAGLARSSV
jgi:carbon-monoxide dehydrogenase medium subunit